MVLAQLPDLLLLDEPDNHLDHPSRQLLTPGPRRTTRALCYWFLTIPTSLQGWGW